MSDHICDFKLDTTRQHKRAGRCFTICSCGRKGQASTETGQRFTTGRTVPEKKKPTGLKTYQSQRDFLAIHGFSVQKFFDKAYSDFVASVLTEAV